MSPRCTGCRLTRPDARRRASGLRQQRPSVLNEAVGRYYTSVTVKTLFGEASNCAYPGCAEPLIFRDRGQTTAVAEIAHIRSETPGGPRHDPDFTGDVNGADNLLLLCGKHHRPVDRHEITYTVVELEGWKSAQRAAAGDGTALSDADARSYLVLTSGDLKVLTDIARLAQRVVAVAKSAHQKIQALREDHEITRRRAWTQMGPMYACEEDGTQYLLGPESFSLSVVEQRAQEAQIASAWQPHQISLQNARALLDEEIAVLRMKFGVGPISVAASQIASAAAVLPIGSPTLDSSVDHLDGLVTRLWRVAHGDGDGDGDGI